MSVDDRKPVILFMFANDRLEGVGYLRNLPEEARRLRAALEPAESAGLCELVVRQNATAADVLDVLQDKRYRDRVAIIHYGGHADGYRLMLESAAGRIAAANAAGLAEFLGRQRGLRLVFLNGCSTGAQSRGLLEAGVAAVVATSQAIDDAAAVEFAARFYRALGRGGPASLQRGGGGGGARPRRGDPRFHGPRGCRARGVAVAPASRREGRARD